MRKITLVLGGIRSGKSYFAEQKALFYSDKPIYIATAIPFDHETRERIAIHRKRRRKQFKLIEEPYDINKILSNLADETVVVDCLTLNLSNRILSKGGKLDLGELIKDDEKYLAQINQLIIKNRLNIIFVSNEVGFAPIENNKLGRYFQDLQGRWNMLVASYADEVYIIQAGIPNQIKKVPVFPFKISAPSYLLPGGYIENITYLMDKVDDIQLLLFDMTEDDPLFQEELLTTLSYLQKEARIAFSVHMPVKPKVFNSFSKRLDLTISTIERLSMFLIGSYTFHYDLPDGYVWEKIKEQDKKHINNTYITFFNRIKTKFPGIDISLENTDTPLSALDSVISDCDISYCIDIGHLLKQKRALNEIEPRLAKTSVIHLHGIEKINGKIVDHRAFTYDRTILQFLEKFKGILTIENYHKVTFNHSLKLLREYF